MEWKKQLAIMENPHTMLTSQPKIPDGKIQKSLGLSNQTAGELVAAQSGVGLAQPVFPQDGTIHILMYAGQDGGAVVWNTVGGKASTAAPSTAYTSKNAAGETLGYRDTPHVSISGLNATTGGDIVASIANSYSQWRVVSQGLKLGLLNPAEEDDGWWECYRVNDPFEAEDIIIRPTTNADTTTFCGVTPMGKLNSTDPDGYNGLIAVENLANQGSYRTGLLRDIHKEYFQLMPSHIEHEMRTQVDRQKVTGADIVSAVTIGAPEDGKYAQFAAGSTRAKDIVDTYIDPSFDMLYIRIHGRSTGNPTRLHYNLVGNHEVTFPTDSLIARFQTESHARPKDVEMTKAKIHNAERKPIPRPGY